MAIKRVQPLNQRVTQTVTQRLSHSDHDSASDLDNYTVTQSDGDTEDSATESASDPNVYTVTQPLRP
jgi:hypothetical protein